MRSFATNIFICTFIFLLFSLSFSSFSLGSETNLNSERCGDLPLETLTQNNSSNISGDRVSLNESSLLKPKDILSNASEIIKPELNPEDEKLLNIKIKDSFLVNKRVTEVFVKGFFFVSVSKVVSVTNSVPLPVFKLPFAEKVELTILLNGGETLLKCLNSLLQRVPSVGVGVKPVKYELGDVEFFAFTSVSAFFLLAFVSSGGSSAKTTTALLPFVPLYSRIKKEKVLEHQYRLLLYQIVSSNPGVSFNQLKEMTALKNGTLQHHLATLEREHYIKSKKDGKKRRFYLNGKKVSPLSSTQQQIIDYIKQKPDITQSEIATLMKMSRQNIHYHIKKMEKEHILKMKHGKGNSSYLIFERKW